MNHTETPSSTHIPEAERLSHTERLFGIHFPLHLEPFIYAVTQKMSPDYSGGYWTFYALSNEGFYMAPTDREIYHAKSANGFECDLSGDALGVVACLTAYSHLSFTLCPDFAPVMARHYHLLREWMFEHPEAGEILRMTD